MDQREQIESLLANLNETASTAHETWERAEMGLGDPMYDTREHAAWCIENAFLQLLVATEMLRLDALRELVLEDLAKAKEEGFAKGKMGPDEPYSAWMARHRQYTLALEALGHAPTEQRVAKDLTSILRATIYPITDDKLFGSPPSSEAEVHDRIEGVLRCVFPDLKRKPALTKAIKNFEPDTGLRSIGTLIEYKFIDRKSIAPAIADQILADTRGYVSKQWSTFIYVIYETGRFRPESEWNQLLRDCGIPQSTSVVVLSGVPKPVSRKKKASKKSRAV